MKREPIQLKAGLQFRSRTFQDVAEIVSIDEVTDSIEIRRIPSDGNAFMVTWGLQSTKHLFNQGFYFIPKQIPNDVTTS